MKNKSKILFCLLCVAMIFLCGFIGHAEEESNELTVSSVSVSNSQKGVLVRWSSSEQATSYRIMRKTADSEYALLQEVSSVTSFQDDTAKSGVSYTYKVIPCSENAQGECASEKTVTCLYEPEILSVRSTTQGVEIKWTAVEGATKYTVSYKREGAKGWSVAGHTTETVLTHKKAPDGAKIIYTVRAKKGSAKSSFFEGVNIFYLATPQLKSISSVINGINFTWSKTKAAESYLIYRRGAGQKWTYLTSVSADYGSYTDTTMTPGKTFAYTVRAVKGENMSAYTSGMPCRYVPVNDVTAISCLSEGLTVKWKASPYARLYRLYRKTEGSETWKKIATLASDKTSYTDKKVEHGKTYTYTLVTVSGSYKSTYNQTGKSYTYISPPETLLAVKSSAGYKVSWNKVSGATHYYIYRKSTPDAKWKKIARVGNTSGYTDKTADLSESYLYCVRAGKSGRFFSNYGNAVETTRIDPNKKMVALTYDDGPHNTYTNRILDVLEKYDARATFFVVGERIESNNKALTRAAKLGCEIGNHTYDHMNIPSYSESAIKSNLKKTDDLVKKYTGSETTVMRPPGGATSKRSLAAVNKPVIMWSVDTRDWEHRTASRTVSHIKNNVYDGSIILMHDLYSATASATESIVPWLIKNGYQLVTVSELLYYRGIDATNGVVYRQARP